MGKFEIFKGSNSQFYFRLKSGNGEIILASEGYTTKANCENGVNSVRNNAETDANYTRFNDQAGKPRFNLKAANHEIIGASQGYSSTQARDNGIESVKSHAPNAGTVDLT